MTDEGVRFTNAIVRPPADSYAAGITTSTLGAPDVTMSRAQHAAYCAALVSLGVTVQSLPQDAAYPDSTFVEDTAVVTRHGAIISRPGAPSRAGEVTTMRAVLEMRLGAVAAITTPGTLDGGDICQAGGHFFIGLSQRTNDEGARQLTHWLAQSGYSASTIDIRDNSALLHLKSGISWLGNNTVVVTDALVDHPALRDYTKLVTNAAESYAANCVRVNDAVLMAKGYPDIAKAVAATGREVVVLDVSEFAKMDGGLSCLSIRVP